MTRTFASERFILKKTIAFALLAAMAATAQAAVIKGKVTDESGEPLIGATVRIETVSAHTSAGTSAVNTTTNSDY